MYVEGIFLFILVNKITLYLLLVKDNRYPLKLIKVHLKLILTQHYQPKKSYSYIDYDFLEHGAPLSEKNYIETDLWSSTQVNIQSDELFSFIVHQQIILYQF